MLFYFILQLFFLCSLLNISTHLLSLQGKQFLFEKVSPTWERDRYKLLRVTERMTHDTTNGFCGSTRQEGRLSLCCVVLHSWPTLGDPMDCSLAGSSVHGIFLARILEWAAISFSRGSSPPRDQTWVSCIAGRFFTNWATREAHWSISHDSGY